MLSYGPQAPAEPIGSEYLTAMQTRMEELHSPYGLAVELLGTPPLADAVQAEDMVAFLQDPKAALRGGFLIHDDIHADAAALTRAPLNCKRQLHVLLVLQDTLLRQRTKTPETRNTYRVTLVSTYKEQNMLRKPKCHD